MQVYKKDHFGVHKEQKEWSIDRIIAELIDLIGGG